MRRDEALAILHEMTETESLRKHARAVEIVMRASAAELGADVDAFGAAGLLHDADYEKWPAEHPHRIVARLESLGQGEIAHAISAHYTKWGVPYTTPMSRALIASDELTGFVVACCLVRPDGILSLEPKSVLKRFKDKAFAAKVERDEVLRACEIAGTTLEAQAAKVIAALLPHAEELGIRGRAAQGQS